MGLKRRVIKRTLKSKFYQSLLLRAINVYDEIELEKHNQVDTRFLIEKFFSLIKPKSNFHLVRFGDNKDGGYLLANSIAESSCVFSIGVGDNISFDESISKLVSKVIMVDHTVDFFPRNPKVTFIKKKLVSQAIDESLHITLSELHEMLEPNTPVILKMDIEGSEWQILDNLDTKQVKRFDQIVIELHGILDKAKSGKLEAATETIERLLQDFEIVNTHANNFSSYEIFLNFPVIDVIEITFVRKDIAAGMIGGSDLNDMNFPNNPSKPEIFLTHPHTLG
jgi:hypothetical protein